MSGFILNPANLQKVADGTKAQTRRIAKAGQVLITPDNAPRYVTNAKGTRLKVVGRDYAALYGRGKGGAWWVPSEAAVVPYEELLPFIWRWKLEGCKIPFHHYTFDNWQPLRIRLLDIRCEDVRGISHDDAIAEGYGGITEFLQVWASMHDKKMPFALLHKIVHGGDLSWFDERPAKFYQALAYTFEVVK